MEEIDIVLDESDVINYDDLEVEIPLDFNENQYSISSGLQIL